MDSDLIDISSDNDENDEDAGGDLDETDLEKLEAARAALKAELNGESDERYDALLEEQYQALASQINEYASKQGITADNDEDSKDSGDKDNEFGDGDYFRPEGGLAITIPGSKFASEDRTVSDRTKKESKKLKSEEYDVEFDAYNYKNGKFDADTLVKRTKKESPSKAVVSGELGNLKSIAQGYGDSESEEEGEVDRAPDNELADDLLEYAMNEMDSGTPVGKSKGEGNEIQSQDGGHMEGKKRDRGKDKKKDRGKRDKDREKSRQERKERKEKERERRDKEKGRKKDRDEKKDKGRDDKNKENIPDRSKDDKDKRSR